MITFNLEKTEFIELNHLLKATKLCDSGGMANTVIAEGRVKVDGYAEFRKRCKIRAGQVVEFGAEKIIVAGSGQK